MVHHILLIRQNIKMVRYDKNVWIYTVLDCSRNDDCTVFYRKYLSIFVIIVLMILGYNLFCH